MKDELKKEKLKKLFELLINEYKRLDTDLLAHRRVIEALKAHFPNGGLEGMVEAMQIHPVVLRTVDEKYANLLKTWNNQLDLMESVSEFFEAWKPTGPIN